MEMRVLTANDVQQFRALRLMALDDAPVMFGRTYEEEVQVPIEELAEGITPNEDRFTLGAFDQQDLVGVVSFERDEEAKSRHKGELHFMYAHPDYRGTDLASDLIEAFKAEVAKLEGMKMITLMVVSENEAGIGLYEKHGFKRYGLEPRAMYDGTQYYDDVMMYYNLEDFSEKDEQ